MLFYRLQCPDIEKVSRNWVSLMKNHVLLHSAGNLSLATLYYDLHSSQGQTKEGSKHHQHSWSDSHFLFILTSGTSRTGPGIISLDLTGMVPHGGIVAFYENKAVDSHGRRLHEILRWPATDLEYCHDYIQILFPLPEKSAFNDPAPTIDKEVFEAFRTRKDLRNRLRDSFEKILWFYGYQIHKDGNGRLEVRVDFSLST